MKTINLSASQLRQAANIKAQIEKLQGDLTSVLGTTTLAATAPALAAAPATAVASAPAVTSTAPKKRLVSAATRAKMAAAQQQRWATKQPVMAVQQPKGKSKMSPAAKALLSAKLKAYWGKRKAAKR